MDIIISNLLRFKNEMKMYHWSVDIGSKHVFSDKIISKMDELIDKFVETLIGSRKKRPKIELNIVIRSFNNQEILTMLEDFRHWLTENLVGMIKDHETDLINLVDEMVAEVNQGLYLLRMK